MTRTDIVKKVRSTVIQTKKALSGSRAGEFKTRFYGSGYDFDQLRNYQQGDDVRFIDWKSSARAGKTLLREYKDERSRTMHILVDVSSSMLYGTQSLRSYDVLVQLVVALIVMGETTDDAIGLHFLNNEIEKSIAPRAGKKHTACLMNALFHYIPSKKSTSLRTAFEQFGKRYRQKSLVFILSDLIDDEYETTLRILSQWHEVAVIRIDDQNHDRVLRACQGITLEDSELECSYEVALHKQLAQVLATRHNEQSALLKKLQIPCCDCLTHGQHVEQLVTFLHRYF